MDAAQEICARLLREGAVERTLLADFDLPEVRRQVEQRLESVGLALATSAYCEHVGLRLSSEAAADESFDAASNLGLHADHCALLVIAWARLVLQKRTAADRHEVPGQQEIPGSHAARDYRPQVRVETLAREFRGVLGSRSHIKALVTQLRKLRFLAGRGEIVEAGPLLELGIDGERMVAFIRRGILQPLLDAPPEEAVPHTNGQALALWNTLRELGGPRRLGELVKATGKSPAHLRSLLRDLVEEKRVKRSGQRFRTRYEAEEDGCSGSAS